MTDTRLFPLTFTSPRLYWRGLDDGDVDVIYRQFSDPEMCAHFSDPPCSMTEAADIIHHYADMRQSRYLRYATFMRDTGEFVGTCGYHFYDVVTKQVEIGYDVWKSHWCHGYATEMLTELLPFCIQNLAVTTIYAVIGRHNVASQASVRKFGFVKGDFLRDVSDHERQTTECWHFRPIQ